MMLKKALFLLGAVAIFSGNPYFAEAATPAPVNNEAAGTGGNTNTAPTPPATPPATGTEGDKKPEAEAEKPKEEPKKGEDGKVEDKEEKKGLDKKWIIGGVVGLALLLAAAAGAVFMMKKKKKVGTKVSESVVESQAF